MVIPTYFISEILVNDQLLKKRKFPFSKKKTNEKKKKSIRYISVTLLFKILVIENVSMTLILNMT